MASVLGVGKSALSMIETGRAALSERNRNILVQEFNLNPEWIEGGRGDMFNCPREEFVPYTRRTDRTVPMQSVPLYNIEGTAGLVPLFLGQENVKPVDYIHIPNIPRCDGAIYVAGDSMYPLLKSGDIVLYKQISNMEDVFWGDMYLLSIDIDGEEYITVKYIHKSEFPRCVKLVSQNPLHADKDINVDKIKALAFVKASIRMNTMR